ncbi:hypothetical protein AAE02nite_03710 [Adhaeribacter aerolatus]|uniref:Uncharacterized protein n=1 Tax=Adhaeribacter aerolatus TaxID=670289 RepID=A0A512ASZ6_9BACT|nr:DUF6687 family protein [Adhaeribacter aerolatus]GEO02707.1 hypothetical protein AAE02nite_03710 [Adhaeribacter aerolatus]
MHRTFLPFTQVKHHKAIVVDSLHPNGLVLSHWRGAPVPDGLAGDTSADIVFNALHAPKLNLDYEFVTANHFDIDGFVGVWALLNPELALAYEAILRQAALIGDFRELNLANTGAGHALQLVCWINAKEKELFYRPFGADETAENEVIASVPKFDFFLREFEKILLQPETEQAVWDPEYNQVMRDYARIHSSATTVEKYPEIGLVCVQTPEPVHYYALFSVTSGYDIVLAQYQNNRYELEYKYTTWVDIHSRPTLPRLSLAPLVIELNNAETTGLTWTTENITDTGPILRLAGTTLNKAERYANPTERPIYASSLSAPVFKNKILAYFRTAYKNIQPEKNWSWEKVKMLNQQMFRPR